MSDEPPEKALFEHLAESSFLFSSDSVRYDREGVPMLVLDVALAMGRAGDVTLARLVDGHLVLRVAGDEHRLQVPEDDELLDDDFVRGLCPHLHRALWRVGERSLWTLAIVRPHHRVHFHGLVVADERERELLATRGFWVASEPGAASEPEPPPPEALEFEGYPAVECDAFGPLSEVLPGIERLMCRVVGPVSVAVDFESAELWLRSGVRTNSQSVDRFEGEECSLVCLRVG